ncbi:hypothetical protein L1887_29924 [Cichorium endivia]|nr:hypothetical protein L1887_29924 [Cichorium endivia]
MPPGGGLCKDVIGSHPKVLKYDMTTTKMDKNVTRAATGRRGMQSTNGVHELLQCPVCTTTLMCPPIHQSYFIVLLKICGLISGYSECALPSESTKIKADEVTILGLLVVFNRTGNAKEAVNLIFRIFDSFRVKPTMKHYSCVLDTISYKMDAFVCNFLCIARWNPFAFYEGDATSLNNFNATIGIVMELHPSGAKGFHLVMQRKLQTNASILQAAKDVIRSVETFKGLMAQTERIV